MKISELDYVLPEEKIAIYPPKIRGATKLLVCDKNGVKKDDLYKNLDNYLHSGDIVILNNTKVIAARLKCKKQSGKEVEILLTEKHEKEIETKIWDVIYRGRVKTGDILKIETAENQNKNKGTGGNNVKVLEVLGGGIAKVEFEETVEKISQKYGEIPIPPYLNREEEELDKTRYQTEFADKKGSVAAPTASLNFTQKLLTKLTKKGVKIYYITLHVGLGTFMPVRSDETDEHVMHSEYFEVGAEVLNAIKNTKSEGGKVLGVGTTVVRTLEYIFSNDLQNSKIDLTGNADIFITPGYEFKALNMVLTNFHAPRSTPLLLVSAALGVDNYKKVYGHALSHNYKFLSYGDSMLIEL